MLSAEVIAAVKVAVLLCNGPERNDVYLKPFLYYKDPKRRDSERWDSEDSEDSEDELQENMRKLPSDLLQTFNFGKRMHDKVFEFVSLIGNTIFTWVKYHEENIGIPHHISEEFLKSSIFTMRGLIDNKKAAEEMLRSNLLNVKRRYKLACIYCFVDKIPYLFNRMSKENQKEFYDAEDPENIKQPQLVKFWTYFVKGEIDKLRGELYVDEYLLKMAIESGSKAAVEYCLERTDVGEMETTLMNAATWFVIDRAKMFRHNWGYGYRLTEVTSLVPVWFFLDTLCYLLDKMTPPQQIEFLTRDLVVVENANRPIIVVFIVLKWLLKFPYQDYFMRTAILTWEFLPEWSFFALLIEIREKICYVTFNYRKLLKEFWCESPQRYKRFVFSNRRHFGYPLSVNGGDFIVSLLSLDPFTYDDRRNVEIILESATDEEKREILFSEGVKKMGIRLIGEEKWGRLNILVSNSCTSPEQVNKFKREFVFSHITHEACINFLTDAKYEAFESLMRWSALTEEEIVQFKREIIHSNDAKEICVSLITKNGVKVAKAFCIWLISSEEELEKFKKELIYSEIGEKTCVDLISNCEFEIVDEFIHWFISKEEEQRQFRRNFAYSRGTEICCKLIKYNHCGLGYSNTCWKGVDNFLTFCFSSEVEKNEFKRHLFLEGSASKIHFKLIFDNKWRVAKELYLWLRLSFEETKKLKKETFFSNMDEINNIITEYYVWYHHEHYEFDSRLKWCLNNREMILEFKEEFDKKHGFKSSENEAAISKEKTAALKVFYSTIDEVLEDYSEETEKESVF